MSILFDCECGQRVQAGDDQVGKKVRCPKCMAIVMVPIASVEPPDVAPAGYGHCPSCGELIADEATRCGHCGEQLDDTLMVRDDSDDIAKRRYKRGMRGLSRALLFFGAMQLVCGGIGVVSLVNFNGGADVVVFSVVAAVLLLFSGTQIVLGVYAGKMHNWVNYVVAIFAGGMVALNLLAMIAQAVLVGGFDGIGSLCGIVILIGFFWTAVSNLRLHRMQAVHHTGE